MIAALALLLAQEAPPPPAVHSVCDLSQEFTFYMDGRFHSQYLKDFGRDARNWGSLHRLDLTNVNLLVLTGGDPRLPYAAAALDHVEAYVRGGGALLVMADGAETPPPVAPLLERFGARLTRTRLEAPLRGPEEAAAEIRSGTALDLGREWSELVRDARQRPALAQREFGAGRLIVATRGLFGSNPDASDPINAAWVAPLLRAAAVRKPVDAKRPHRSTWAEHAREIGPLVLEYHDGTAPFAERIAEEYTTVRPHLVAITGVEPAPGMIKRLLILPTGGGGFSSGERIAIGAWWGDYPERRYPMIELIGHEAGHSWVLPHPEPLWNEPIATWLGIQVGRRLGMPEADATLENQIAAARREDPQLDRLDPQAPGASHALVWGKSFFVFEELERRHGPGAMAKYFRAKRELAAAARPAYTMDDCVAVWSRAVGEDLTPFFRGLAFEVDAARSDLAPAAADAPR